MNTGTCTKCSKAISLIRIPKAGNVPTFEWSSTKSVKGTKCSDNKRHAVAK